MVAFPTIVAGSYERFLFGFKAPGADGADEKQTDGLKGTPPSLSRCFMHAAHQNAVKCVASKGPFLASGGGDDQIHLYDLKHDKDLGFLINPGDGPVPCLEFFCPLNASGVTSATPSHMFSGSQDGSIAIWQAGHQWEHLKLMKGHKGAVNALSIHPTGRLALSTSHDGSLRMWDLSKGRCTYTSKLDAEGDDVSFSPGGGTFTLTSGPKVTVHATSGEGGLLGSLQHSRRVLCSVQEHEHVLLTGLEDGSIKVWDLRTSNVQGSIERAHNTRIRGLCSVLPGGPGASVPQHLASASSDGVVKVWDVRMMSNGSFKGGHSSGATDLGSGSIHAAMLAQASTGARLTCLTTVDPAGQSRRAGTGTAAAAASDRVADVPKAISEAPGDDAAIAEKRIKRAAKKRARAEAKAAHEAALTAGSVEKGQDKENGQQGRVGDGASASPGQQQQQQQQRIPKKKKAGSFGMGDDDEFEVIPAAGSSDEGGGDEGGGFERAKVSRNGSGAGVGKRGREQQVGHNRGSQHGKGETSRGGSRRGGKRPMHSEEGGERGKGGTQKTKVRGGNNKGQHSKALKSKQSWKSRGGGQGR